MLSENEEKVKIIPHIIISVFLSLMGLLVLASFMLLYRAVDLPENRIYEVVPGATSREIAYELARKHIIRFPWLFNVYLSLKNVDTKLEAGRYEFPESRMSLREVAAFLASGARAREVEFTIPEGFTMEQIERLLKEKGVLEKDDMSFIGIAGSQSLKLEGYFFPDTYRVYEHATGEDIMNIMVKNFHKKVDPLLPEIDARGRTVNEILTMASMLEKEVRTEPDMKKVADILWRRLDAGWALQVDATLKYEIGGSSPSLTYEELQIDSPYNTYTYTGLPSTPIGNPGLKSITAALYPEPNEYWFYLSKLDGETVFSKTLPEHNRNKAMYVR